MNAVAVIFMILTSIFHDVGKSEEGLLRASIDPNGENYILRIQASNQIPADTLVLSTTNSWTINLCSVPMNGVNENVFLINPIQRSVLIEEEVIGFELKHRGMSYSYSATDRSFFKNRLNE